MKLRFVILLILVSMFTVAAQTSVLTRPTIRIDAGGQGSTEQPYSYCWPVAPNNNRCNFTSGADFENPLEVEAGQTITIILENAPGDPASLTATVIDQATQNFTTYNLDATQQAIFSQALPLGEQVLQIDAIFDEVAGVRAYVSYRFLLNVIEPGSPAQPTPTVETTPTEVVAVVTTAEPTAEVAATEETTPTEETVESTQEVVATAEATEEVAAVQATAEPTQENVIVPTQETIATATLPAATVEVITFTATPTPTTEIPPTIPPTATLVEPTSTTASGEEPTQTTVPLATAGEAIPVAEVTATEVASVPTTVNGPTATTIGLVTQPEQTQPPTTATPMPTVTASATSPIAQPNEPANLQLTFAGQNYQPVGVNFCQLSEAGEQVCVDRPLEAEGEVIALLRNFAAQLRLASDAPRPESMRITFLNINTLQEVRSVDRRGDLLVLFNVDVNPGIYFLRITVDWGATEANYFFRVRVS